MAASSSRGTSVTWAVVDSTALCYNTYSTCMHVFVVRVSHPSGFVYPPPPGSPSSLYIFVIFNIIMYYSIIYILHEMAV